MDGKAQISPEKAAVLPIDEKQASTEPPPPPSAGVSAIACLYFPSSSSRMTIKVSASYFACASPATTAASLSSIWFQPSS
jgi:hypothetical protein